MSQENSTQKPKVVGKKPMKGLRAPKKLDEQFEEIVSKTDDVDLSEYFSDNFMRDHSLFANKFARQTLQNAIVQFPQEKLTQSLPITIWCLENMIRISKNIRTKKNYKKNE